MRTSPERLIRVITVRPAGETSTLVGGAFRTFDLVIALAALLVLGPLMALIALALWIDEPGPVVRSEQHLGLDLEPFILHVFQTTQAGHLTRVGRFVRCTRADRLPQLFDVLAGAMSLVGPAPARPSDVTRYSSPPCHDHWFLRFAVKPGMTGLAQLTRPAGRTLTKMMSLDIEYVCHRSLRMNLWILARTPLKVLDLRRPA